MRSASKVAVLAAAAAVGLAGCSSSTSTTPAAGGATSAGSSAQSTGGGAAASGLKVGMAYDVGGRGDQSFNDAAAAGLDKAKAELGVEGKEASATNGEPESAREERLQQLIDAGYTNIVAVGFAYAESVKKVAADNPDVKFALIDSTDAKAANIENVTFAEQEGSFLVGAAAALKSKTNHIGFVGGVQTALIKKFEVGYIAGAKAVNPSIVVDTTYLTQPPDFSGFASPDKGKTASEGMFQKGADIVYHAAGGSGGGVFQAAKAAGAGKWAIGVDSDQALTADASVRDVILTSMIKKVDVGVYDYIKSIKDGTFTGGEKVFDLKAGGVDYATTGGHIDDIKSKLDEYKQKIISGEIKVASS